MKYPFIILVFLALYGPANSQTLIRNNVGTAGFSYSGTNQIIQQSIGQPSGFTTLHNQEIILRQGFIQAPAGLLSQSNPEVSIEIRPNPGNGFFQILLKSESDSQFSYLVTSVSGQLCGTGSLNTNTPTGLSLYPFSPGIYTLTVINKNAPLAHGRIILTP